MAKAQLVFVYGSLMRGLDLHHLMESGAFAGEGTTGGTLVSLDRYPGLIEGSGTVRGELYQFDDLPTALDILDDVEEFDPTDPAGSPYVRVTRTVTTSGGTQVDAWLYLYQGPVKDAPRIDGGDWRSTLR
jgi:gamma-glutamylcyclotransferase (GGCT)/AIG2-like uncharacterized protein YtfP